MTENLLGLRSGSEFSSHQEVACENERRTSSGIEQVSSYQCHKVLEESITSSYANLASIPFDDIITLYFL